VLVKAQCQAAVPTGRLVKALFTWQKSPNHPEETALLNVLKEHGDFAPGETYRITIEKDEAP